jgi:hypothetical protein
MMSTSANMKTDMKAMAPEDTWSVTVKVLSMDDCSLCSALKLASTW